LRFGWYQMTLPLANQVPMHRRSLYSLRLGGGPPASSPCFLLIALPFEDR
jgi:hypothetical protein